MRLSVIQSIHMEWWRKFANSSRSAMHISTKRYNISFVFFHRFTNFYYTFPHFSRKFLYFLHKFVRFPKTFIMFLICFAHFPYFTHILNDFILYRIALVKHRQTVSYCATLPRTLLGYCASLAQFLTAAAIVSAIRSVHVNQRNQLRMAMNRPHRRAVRRQWWCRICARSPTFVNAFV